MRSSLLALLLFPLSLIAQPTGLPHEMAPHERALISDYRLSRGEGRGITTPPSFPVRTMAEWEEVQSLCITWVSYPTILKQIVHYALDEVEVIIALQERGWGFAGSDKIAGFDDEDDLSASRFFYCAKANGKERDAGLGGFDVKRCGSMLLTLTGSGNPRTTSRANTHPTVKPVDLMRYLCRLVTPPGGVVIDPFAGSGSTGVAAILEGFRPILIEEDGGDQSLGYVDIINARCMHALLGDLL